MRIARSMTVLSVVVLAGVETAAAGAARDPGVVSYKKNTAGVSLSGLDLATIGSWVLKIWGKPDIVGPAATSLEVAGEFADAAEQFARVAPQVDRALDDVLPYTAGVGQPVSRGDLELVELAVLRELNAHNFAGFGLNQAQLRKLVRQRLEARGLRGW